jgi:hypothetical protein
MLLFLGFDAVRTELALATRDTGGVEGFSFHSGHEAQTVPYRGEDPAPDVARPDDLRSRYIKSCRLSDNERQPHDGHVSQDCSEPGVGRR